MLVRELIERLKELPEDRAIVVRYDAFSEERGMPFSEYLDIQDIFRHTSPPDSFHEERVDDVVAIELAPPQWYREVEERVKVEATLQDVKLGRVQVKGRRLSIGPVRH